MTRPSPVSCAVSCAVSRALRRGVGAGLLAVLASGVVAGCSEPAGRAGEGIGEPVPAASEGADAGGDGPSDLPEVPAGTEDLRTAVRAYGDALLTGRAPLASALLTDRCRDRVDAAELARLVEQAGELYGEPLPLASFRTDPAGGAPGAVVGDVAEVDYSFAGAEELVQADEEWELTADGWRLADC